MVRRIVGRHHRRKCHTAHRNPPHPRSVHDALVRRLRQHRRRNRRQVGRLDLLDLGPHLARCAGGDRTEVDARDAVAVDTLDSVGVYFGTRSGKIFGSADEGDSWSELLDGLPPVISVKVASI